MAQISLEEAIRLGLVPDEELQRLAAQGILGSPFTRGGRGQAAPFWHLPPITRGGLFQPRFGLGPLSQGLSLSPPSPAISGGGVPVGRRAGASNQGPPPLETLIGAGDVNEIARRVASGEVNPNDLPANLRQQVLQLLQSRPQSQPQPGRPQEDPTGKSLALAKQVLGLAKQFLPQGSKAAQIIDQSLGAPPDQSMVEQQAQPTPGQAQALPQAPAPIPSAGGGAPTGGQDQTARLQALGFSPEQIAAIMKIPQGPDLPVGRAELTLGGRTEGTTIPLVGDRPADILVQNGQGRWEPIPAELQSLLASGVFHAADVKALANQGFTAAQIQDALAPIDALGAGVEPTGGGLEGTPGAGAEFGPGQVIGGIGGALTIGQAVSNDKTNTAQKALGSTAGAAQIGQSVAPVVGLGEAVPYLGAAAGLANIGLTASGPLPSDQKAAMTAIDAAAAALSIALSTTGVGAALVPFVMPLSGLLKENIMKAYGLSQPVRNAIEATRTGNMANRFIDQIQATTSEAELYDKIRAWSTPLVGGATEKNDPRLNGLDPMPINVFASGTGRPDWQYLGLYGSGGLNPSAPTPREFFDRVLQNPDDLKVAIQAGVDPNLVAPMNAAIRDNLREQIAELRVREYVRPQVMAFSKMAGVLVAEDDVVEALRKTRGVIDTPQFPDYLRQAERTRVARTATTRAMQEQPFLAPADYSTNPAYAGQGEQAQHLYQVGQNEPDKPQYADQADPEGEYQRQQAQAQGIDLPPRRYRAVEAGYSFKPGVGWVDGQGNVGYATGPLPDPDPWLEPAPAPQPPSTATPPSGAAPDQAGAPPTGQSAVPPGSPLAPSAADQPVPLGIMHSGGIVPRTGPYQLQQGETVIPAPDGPDQEMDTADRPGPQDLMWPALADPRRLWYQDENQWHLTPPDEGGPVDAFDQTSQLPTGRYYLDPKTGVPFQDGKNPDPSKTWRLVFDPDELHQAWKARAKDGAPLLVPPSILTRRDWPDVVEQARQSQYVGVHPSILLARESPQGALGGQLGQSPTITDDESPAAIRRFWEGSRPEVPTPDAVPPLHQMPGGRPMGPDEERHIQWSGDHA